MNAIQQLINLREKTTNEVIVETLMTNHALQQPGFIFMSRKNWLSPIKFNSHTPLRKFELTENGEVVVSHRHEGLFMEIDGINVDEAIYTYNERIDAAAHFGMTDFMKEEVTSFFINPLFLHESHKKDKVEEYIKEHGLSFIDDSLRAEVVSDDLIGYAIIDDFVCPIYGDQFFQLKRLYISRKDGKLHRSLMSVGGYMDTRLSVNTVPQAINRYNQGVSDINLQIRWFEPLI